MNLAHASPLPLVLIGAGGHAKVVLGLLQALGRDVIGVCDPELARAAIPDWRGLRVIGNDEALEAWSSHAVELANGVGPSPAGRHVRQRLHAHYAQRGFRFPPLVHPNAIVDASATVAAGAQVMAGAVLQADVVVGEFSVVNTGAQLDHDCRIGQHAHVAPGAVLCGGVTVGSRAFLGAACTILPGLDIGDDCVVAAGAVLARRLCAGQSFLPHLGSAVRHDPSA